MRRSFLNLLSVGTCLWLAGVTAYGQGSDSLTPGMVLEHQVIAERNKLQHGKVVIRARYAPHGSLADAGDKAETFRFIIEFDDDKIRMEKPPGPIRRIATPSAVMFSDLHGIYYLDAKEATLTSRDDLFHPRQFGMDLAETQVLDNFINDQSVVFSDRKNETVVEEVLNGISVRHVSYDRIIGNHLDYWIAVEDGPRFIQARAMSQGVTDELSVEWQQYGVQTRTWYPQTVSFRQSDGGKVTSEELATVESADFETRPDESRFTLSSFGLEVGAVVRQNGIPKYWDGSAVKTQDQINAVKYKRPEEKSRRWLLLVNAIVLAILAAFVVFRKRLKG